MTQLAAASVGRSAKGADCGNLDTVPLRRSNDPLRGQRWAARRRING